MDRLAVPEGSCKEQLLVTGSYLVKMLCSTEYPTDMYYGYMALWYHYLRGFGRCGLLLGLVGGLAYVNQPEPEPGVAAHHT